MKTELIYNKENRKEFFAKIEELTEKDKHTECINALESIPAEERDYEITYQLARALQNFAIVGDDDKGTEYEIGEEVLLNSLEILESVRKKVKTSQSGICVWRMAINIYFTKKKKLSLMHFVGQS